VSSQGQKEEKQLEKSLPRFAAGRGKGKMSSFTGKKGEMRRLVLRGRRGKRKSLEKKENVKKKDTGVWRQQERRSRLAFGRK